ncbi:hypothetical protein [Dactylosporangium sp. NPDC005555]|uniref:hypothetical protein n=1 Tax=Dactylosporangium sp. NPDC005555 TaxID=3154889 RepID=UPI0033AC7641
MTEIAVPRRALASAARALAHAGRWQDATALLDAAPAEDPLLALTFAQVAVDADWFAGTASAPDRLANATRLAPSLDDAGRWDLTFTGLRHEYRAMLSQRGPAAALLRRAADLALTAPDEVRRGWAEMYQGLISDNLLDSPTTAPPHYEAALQAGAADPLLAREALRHLGGHDHDNGDDEAALVRWRRATELGAAAGNVPGTLSQQLLLAVLARAAGNEAGAVALAAEIARWADAIGAADLTAQATAFLNGTDPTAPPQSTPPPPATMTDGATNGEVLPERATAEPAPTTPAAESSTSSGRASTVAGAGGFIASGRAASPVVAEGSSPSGRAATARGAEGFTAAGRAATGAGTQRTAAPDVAATTVPAAHTNVRATKPAEVVAVPVVSFMTAPLATTPRQ